MPNKKSDSPRSLKTLVTAWEVIQGLIELNGAGVTELATHLGISKGTVYTYLQTLEQLELVAKTDFQYRLSHQFLLVGEYVRNNNLLFKIGHKEVDELATDIGQYAHLVVEEYGRGVIVHHAMGMNATDYEYQRSKLQQRDPLHMTASGKAILASLPEARVAEIIDQYGLDQSTQNTITNAEQLYTEVEAIQERGYAYNDQEEIRGFRAVAAPVCVSEENVLGAITVSGPTSVFDDEMFHETLPTKVKHTASNIEVHINMMQKQQ